MLSLILRVVVPAALVITGVVLTISDQLGWFRDKNRMLFISEFKRNRATPDTSGAKAFMDRFFFPKARELEPTAPIPVRFVFTGTFTGPSFERADVLMGSVDAMNSQGGIASLCSVAEMEKWAEESPRWIFWFGVALTVIGMLVGAYTGLQDWKSTRPSA